MMNITTKIMTRRMKIIAITVNKSMRIMTIITMRMRIIITSRVKGMATMM